MRFHRFVTSHHHRLNMLLWFGQHPFWESLRALLGVQCWASNSGNSSTQSVMIYSGSRTAPQAGPPRRGPRARNQVQRESETVCVRTGMLGSQMPANLSAHSCRCMRTCVCVCCVGSWCTTVGPRQLFGMAYRSGATKCFGGISIWILVSRYRCESVKWRLETDGWEPVQHEMRHGECEIVHGGLRSLICE